MMKLIDFFKQNFKRQAFFIIGLTIFFYGLLINNLNLWTDEIYSVLMAKDSLSDIWQLLTTEDSKPPLYYLYLKTILTLFPQQYEIWAAHFASAILLIAAQIFAATVIRHDYGEKIALWLIILLALMIPSLWLALEVRTYMLSALLLLMSAIYGVRLLNQPTNRDFALFGILTVLALYTHYYCAVWLMFFYIGLLFFILKDKHFHNVGIKFILTAFIVAICFAPWLYVPLKTGSHISHFWYVNKNFVDFSWQFFTNPLQPEIIQSVFFIATTLASSVFSFILVLGLFEISPKKSTRLFWLTFGSFIATYLFLIIVSYTIRPIVTSRYLKIYSLILYLDAAFVLSSCKNIQKAFGFIALIGFLFTWIDIRAVSFDQGYQTVVSDIRKFISPKQSLLVFDNSNLFCEYYLPEYNCLLITDGNGEILRKPEVLKKLPLYDTVHTPIVFSLFIYHRLDEAKECQIYTSIYRHGHNVRLCRLPLSMAKPLVNSTAEALKKLQ